MWAACEEEEEKGLKRDGREEGMGIKSVLILNYSRDKNLIPKRPLGDLVSSSSLVWSFKRLEGGVSKTTALPPPLPQLFRLI